MKTIINTNFGKILAIAIISMVTFSASAQEEETTPKFSFSGSVDAYYRANITAPNDEEAIAPGSSFAQLPGFSLGMANLIAAYEGEKVGFVADLVTRRQALSQFGGGSPAPMGSQIGVYIFIMDPM